MNIRWVTSLILHTRSKPISVICNAVVTVAVCLNAVTLRTINFQSRTGANRAKLMLFRKAGWVANTNGKRTLLTSSGWWWLNCVRAEHYPSASRTKPIVLCYDINRLSGTHFKNGSYTAVSRTIRDFNYITHAIIFKKLPKKL